MTANHQYDLLVESLRLVAAPASVQNQALPDFVIVTDEVVSSFGDAMLLLSQLEKSGVVKPEGVDAIRRLDEWMDMMPTDGSITSSTTLEMHPFWSQARELAAEALRVLGEELARPSLSQTRWVKGHAEKSDNKM